MKNTNDYSIQDFQQKFCLNDTKNIGGVIWKCQHQLSMGVIVGQDCLGTQYVIKSQPNKRNYRLVELNNYVHSSCFFDTNNAVYDYDTIAHYAFKMLYQYNDFNQKQYAEGHKLELARLQTIVPPQPVTVSDLKKSFNSSIDPVKDRVSNMWDSLNTLYDYLLESAFGKPRVATANSDSRIIQVARPKIIEFDSRRTLAG